MTTVHRLHPTIVRQLAIAAAAAVNGVRCQRVEALLSYWHFGLNTQEIAERIGNMTEARVDRVLAAYRAARRT